jgi:hypothetical protein
MCLAVKASLLRVLTLRRRVVFVHLPVIQWRRSLQPARTIHRIHVRIELDMFKEGSSIAVLECPEYFADTFKGDTHMDLSLVIMKFGAFVRRRAAAERTT